MDEETRDPAVLNHPQTVARMGEVQAEIERLAQIDNLTPDDESYWDELNETFRQLDKHRKSLERSADLEKVRSAAQGVKGTRLIPGAAASTSSDLDRDPVRDSRDVDEPRDNPWDLTHVRYFGRSKEDVRSELHSRALTAIEKMSGASDATREAATSIVERFDDDKSTIAKLALATSSPAYLRAWSKMARSEQHLLSADEARAIDQVRAMSLTDSEGGYLVPFQLDPTVIITSDGSRNDIRQFARQVVATGDRWNGVSSGAVSWRWAAENTAASDGATTFVQPAVPVHKADGFVPISIEALQDEQNVTTEVARLLAFGKDELEAAAFIVGSGSGQPTGIVTALAGTASEVAPATAETFASDDVYGVQGALPARYRARAAWMANNLTYNAIRQFDTAGGSALWARLGEGRPDGLLGREVGEAEDMGSVSDINPAVTADNPVLLFGDFSNYVIADRIGFSVEFIPHLLDQATGRPKGQRGWYAYYRVGADSVHDGAFRLLNVATVTP